MNLEPHNPGVFYGQCSEICGAYPRFMPISLEFVSNNSKLSDYLFYDSDSGYERGEASSIDRDSDSRDSDSDTSESSGYGSDTDTD